MIDFDNITYDEFIQYIIELRGKWGIPKCEYFEMHHIVPRCIGGGSDYKCGRFRKYSHNENCIWLYPNEHFIAHKLLTRKYNTNKKILKAFAMMACVNNDKQESRCLTAEEYAEARIIACKANSGEGNGNFGGGNLTNAGKLKIAEETRRHTKGTHWYNNGSIEARSKVCPEGFAEGRLPETEETKKKHSTVLKGRKRPKRSEEWCKNISKSKKGKKTALAGKKKSKLHRKHISESKRQKILCNETGIVYNTRKEVYTMLGITTREFKAILNTNNKINSMSFKTIV